MTETDNRPRGENSRLFITRTLMNDPEVIKGFDTLAVLATPAIDEHGRYWTYDIIVVWVELYTDKERAWFHNKVKPLLRQSGRLIWAG